MDTTTEANWPVARTIVRDWLAARHARPAWLAQRAGLNRSVVSRFLSGKPLDPPSALKVYAIVQNGMEVTRKIELLEALGVIDLAMMVRDSLAVVGPPRPGGVSQSPLETGAQLMTTAYALVKQPESMPDAIRMFAQAEKTFSMVSDSMAALAVCEVVQNLVTVGDFSSADRHLLRALTMYGGRIDALAELQLTGMAGVLNFAKRDLLAARAWCTQALEQAQLHGNDLSTAAMSQFLGMVNLRLGLAAPSADEKECLLSEAERNTALSCRIHLSHRADDLMLAFDFLRLSQVLQAQGRFDEAQALRRRSRSIFAHEPAGRFIDLDEANLSLEEGNTAIARKKAGRSLQDWGSVRYAQGMARSARVLALAAAQEGRTETALECAVAGLCFNPHATHGSTQKLSDFVVELNDCVAQDLGHTLHCAYVRRLREAVDERRGIFAGLDQIAADRNAAIQQLFDDLCRAPGTQSAQSAQSV